jgi:NAD(P)-dependent dehydrogenase (short-subunit alcohol dehydrogenase family)
MDPATLVITGGNAGLGYHCARAVLARPGWRVVLACRDPERAAAAVEELRAASGPERVEAMALDLASLASVRGFADALASRRDLPPLRALVCNAGLQVVSGARFTEDGYELTFAVNHLGHFLLAGRLLPLLRAPGRIIFVSSGTHDPTRFTGMPAPRWRDPLLIAKGEDDGGGSPGVIGRRAYATSKLANVLCAYELSRRLRAAGRADIAVNAYDPGLMPGSGLGRDYSPWQRFAWRYLFPALRLLPGVSSPAASGAELARLAVDPAFDGLTGRYFQIDREVRSSPESYDLGRARELWEASAGMVGLGPDERLLGAAPS